MNLTRGVLLLIRYLCVKVSGFPVAVFSVPSFVSSPNSEEYLNEPNPDTLLVYVPLRKQTHPDVGEPHSG